jgi:iron complex outermembrane receptor protein
LYTNIFFVSFIIQFYSGTVFSQVKKDTTALAEITIKLSQLRPFKIQLHLSRLLTERINKSDGVILTSVLNKIPGVYMQQGALNTNRISIRGIGSRSVWYPKNKSVL